MKVAFSIFNANTTHDLQGRANGFVVKFTARDEEFDPPTALELYGDHMLLLHVGEYSVEFDLDNPDQPPSITRI